MNYLEVMEDIKAIARENGRNPEEITLIPVSKKQPLDHILSAYRLGARIFGENRIQEALPKIESAPEDISWHMIGTLQKNKVRKAIGKFDLIHSVNSLDLANKISECSLEGALVTSILLEVNTAQGLSSDELREIFPEFKKLKGIKVEGLMTMAPFTQDETVISNHFKNLRKLKEEFKLKHLSMGMSNDYSIAIKEGATLLRIGTAIFGNRK